MHKRATLRGILFCKLAPSFHKGSTNTRWRQPPASGGKRTLSLANTGSKKTSSPSGMADDCKSVGSQKLVVFCGASKEESKNAPVRDHAPPLQRTFRATRVRRVAAVEFVCPALKRLRSHGPRRPLENKTYSLAGSLRGTRPCSSAKARVLRVASSKALARR